MKTWIRMRWSVCLVALLAAIGCTEMAPKPVVMAPPTAQPLKDYIIYSPTTWSGEIRIVRPVIVTTKATLTLQPGTKVFFDLPDAPPGKDPEPWILVLGSLVAMGTAEQPILFSSVRLWQNDVDDMIKVDGAKEAHFRRCVFERGPWAIHVHETAADLSDCIFREDFGGVRFQGGKIVLRGNRFQDNRIGVRSLRSSPVIEENSFFGNLTGIFFREGIAGAVVRRNNFDNREYDIKLGETQTEDVDASGNWWQAAQGGRLAERIYDGKDTPGIGRVNIDSPLAAPWGAEPKKQ